MEDKQAKQTRTRQNQTIPQQIQSVEFSFPFRGGGDGGAGASCEGGIINDRTLHVAEFFRHPSFSFFFPGSRPSLE
jgi:hypothetical protein